LLRGAREEARQLVMRLKPQIMAEAAALCERSFLRHYDFDAVLARDFRSV
jgi:hypothetical protein